MTDVQRAELRLKAAELRVLAASQAASAAAYRRQAEHPIYPGQIAACEEKATEIEAFAARSLAQAELFEARAQEN